MDKNDLDWEVLIADDDRVNRLILSAWLKQWGYRVTSVDDGQKAWDYLQRHDKFRLIILDWIMPGLSGPEVCRKITGPESNSFVYTIILTGKTKKEDIVEALDAGAHDFLTKPFNPEELRSRLAVGVRTVQYETELESKNQLLKTYATKMEQLADERAKQLIHADRMATLGTMAAGIAHEVNNPTAFISGNVQTLERFWDVAEQYFQQLPSDHTLGKRLDFIREEMPATLQGIRTGVTRISEIVKGLRRYSRLDPQDFKLFDLKECIKEALVFCRNRLKGNINVKTQLSEDHSIIRGAKSQIEQVLVNLFVNAADAIGDRKDGELLIQTVNSFDMIHLTVQDNGTGIPEDKIDHIFDPFFTTKEVGKGTGLGLSITDGIIHDHNGLIVVTNNNGACFTITLPLVLTEVA